MLFCQTHRDTLRSPVSPTLLARYDVPGPRYTSYPAVPDWRGAFDATAWTGHLQGLGTASTPLALYVHLPFCASRCLYCGCNATVTTRAEIVDRYLGRLARELAMLGSAIGTRPRITELHLGGGTPNFLTDEQLVQLQTMLRGTFDIDARTECSVEADPRLVTTTQLETLRSLGYTRISYGVQDLDEVVQRAIGRVQPAALVQEAVTMARQAGFSGMNVDLIYGLPHQTPERFARTVEGALALEPDRIACFGYAHVPWMKTHQKRIDDGALPAAWERFALFRDAVGRCVQAGYQWIGIDHFARPDDPLALAADAGRLHRNFMGYTTRRGEHLLGIGTSAISEVDGWFVQNAPALGQWQRDIDSGTLSVSRGHVLSDDDRQRATAIAHLLCNAALPYDLIPGDVAAVVDRYEPFAADGLLRFDTDRITVTPTGRFFLRNMAFALDAYRQDASERQRFSRAV